MSAATFKLFFFVFHCPKYTTKDAIGQFVDRIVNMAKNIALTMDVALVIQLVTAVELMMVALGTVYLNDMADILLDLTVVWDNFFGTVDDLAVCLWLPLV